MFIELVIIGIGLAMDASAVAVSDGMLECGMKIRKSVFIALVFGVFQGLMPIFGYYTGKLFAGFIQDISHYIIFAIFVFLGIRMILESRKPKENEEKLTVGRILLQGVATSIDALIIGVTFAFGTLYIYGAALIIAVITFIFCLLSNFLGCRLGNLLKNKAEVLGGILLVALGFYKLLEAVL